MATKVTFPITAVYSKSDTEYIARLSYGKATRYNNATR